MSAKTVGAFCVTTGLLLSLCSVSLAADDSVSSAAIVKPEWKKLTIYSSGKPLVEGPANMQVGALTVFKSLDAMEKVRWALDLVQDPALARDREVLYAYPAKDFDERVVEQLSTDLAQRIGGKVALVAIQKDDKDKLISIGWPVKWDKEFAKTLTMSLKNPESPYKGGIFHSIAPGSVGAEDFIMQVNSDSKTRAFEARGIAHYWSKPARPRPVEYYVAVDKHLEFLKSEKVIPLVTTSLAWPTNELR